MLRTTLPIPLLILALLASCSHIQPQIAGPGPALSWKALPGWQQDHHAEAWQALQNNCLKLANKPAWKSICTQVENTPTIDDSSAQAFFETHFTPHQLLSDNNQKHGLITAYYEPLLQGSYTRSERYKYPLYAQPKDLLIIELGELYPDLKGKRIRGRLVGNQVVPFYSRAEIETTEPLAGEELLWVDSLEQAFFLQIQGSGRIRLPDGRIIGAGYANQNGHAYVSIGKRLIERGELRRKDVTLFTIRDWLKQHPKKAIELMYENPSYVFFSLRDNVAEGPRGSLNVPLTAERSLAIDPKVVTLGTPMWLDTSHPISHDPIQRLVIAQDTGGAIKGPIRADLFWGAGKAAERAAGMMKQTGALYVLLPKTE